MVTKFNQSGKLGKRITLGFLVLAIIVLVGLLSYSNWKMLKRRNRMENQLNQLNRKIEAFKQQEKRLNVSMQRDAMVEEIARNQMNLKKPGEEVVVVKKPEVQEKEKVEKKWWQEWLNKTGDFSKGIVNKIQFWK